MFRRKSNPWRAAQFAVPGLRTLVEPCHTESVIADEDEISVAGRNLYLLAELRPLAQAMEAEGRPLALLKGASLLFRLYRERIHRRPMTDVDVLVRPVDLPRLEALLLERGYAPARSGEVVYERRKPVPVQFDIHTDLWHLDERGLAALWAGTRVGSERGVPIRLLDPADEVLYLAHHTLVHKGAVAGPRMREVAALIQWWGPEWSWETLAERARAAGAELVLHTALQEAVRREWVHPPAGFLDRIRPRMGLQARLKKRLFRSILALGSTANVGHVHRYLLAPGGRSRWRMFVEQLFPDRAFLRRRYGVKEGEEVFWLLRPMDWAFKSGRLVRTWIRGTTRT